MFVDVHLEVGKVDALEKHLPAGGVLKHIEATQECGLPAAGRSDDDHLFADADCLADVVEDEQIAELLGEVDNLDYRLARLFRLLVQGSSFHKFLRSFGLRRNFGLELILHSFFCHSWRTSFRLHG